MTDGRKISPELRRRREAQLEARRNGSIGDMPKRLDVPESGLDRKDFSYRLVNDTPGRVERLTKDDTWDVVPEVGGRKMDFHADRNTDGSSMRAVLLRKPRDWYEEDQQAKQARIEREMTQIKQGRVRNESGAEQDSAHFYTPAGGIQIQE